MKNKIALLGIVVYLLSFSYACFMYNSKMPVLEVPYGNEVIDGDGMPGLVRILFMEDVNIRFWIEPNLFKEIKKCYSKKDLLRAEIMLYRYHDSSENWQLISHETIDFVIREFLKKRYFSTTIYLSKAGFYKIHFILETPSGLELFSSETIFIRWNLR